MEGEFNGLLTLLTFFPLLGVLLLLVWRNASDTNIKWTAIVTSTITLILSVIVLLSFNQNDPGLQLVDHLPWIPSWGISYFLAIDGISVLMVLSGSSLAYTRTQKQLRSGKTSQNPLRLPPQGPFIRRFGQPEWGQR